jgi:hypothetical protein
LLCYHYFSCQRYLFVLKSILLLCQWWLYLFHELRLIPLELINRSDSQLLSNITNQTCVCVCVMGINYYRRCFCSCYHTIYSVKYALNLACHLHGAAGMHLLLCLRYCYFYQSHCLSHRRRLAAPASVALLMSRGESLLESRS